MLRFCQFRCKSARQSHVDRAVSHASGPMNGTGTERGRSSSNGLWTSTRVRPFPDSRGFGVGADLRTDRRGRPPRPRLHRCSGPPVSATISRYAQPHLGARSPHRAGEVLPGRRQPSPTATCGAGQDRGHDRHHERRPVRTRSRSRRVLGGNWRYRRPPATCTSPPSSRTGTDFLY